MAHKNYLNFNIGNMKFIWILILGELNLLLIGIFLVIMLAIHYNPKKDITMIRKLIEQQISEIDKNRENAN